MYNRMEINKLDNSTNPRIGTQVSGVVHGEIHNDQSTNNYNNYNAETVIVNQNKGQIDPINYNFDLEGLQGTTANRDVELKQMRAVLAKPTTGSGAKFVVLVGMGGAGKTTLAKMYFKAENDREPFEHLIWIDAEEPENVTETFKQLLTDFLGVHRQIVKDEQLANAVYNQILKHKTIIVFDNVEQADNIRRFFPKLVSPKNPPPHVIVTTRNSGGWQDYKDHLVPVGELNLQVCKDYIRESLASLKIPDVDQKWAELAEHFGRLVMALRTATMSIVEQNRMHDADDEQPYTLEEFLKEVKKTRFVEDEENQGLFDPVEATYRPLRQLWTATLDNLSKQIYGQLGERILQVLAFLSPVGVPVTWIRIICADILGPNNKIMMNATHFLISRSIMTKSESKYIVHRVFQSTLFSRIRANPEKLTSTLDWLLPRMEQLYLKLSAESNLQDFYPNLHTLLKQIQLRGNVPDSVVSFLVAMKLSGYVCENLLKEFVQKLLKKDVSISCRSLELVLAQSDVNDSLLLLPDWIRAWIDKMPVQKQLRQIHTYLTPFDSHLPTQNLDILINIYSAVVQVLEKWESESNACLQVSKAQPEVDVLNIVEHLCHGLDKWIYNYDELVKRSKYDEIHTVLQRLENVLDTALTVVFSQTKSANLETKLNYSDVLYKCVQTLVNLENHPWKPCFARCEVTTLERAFHFSSTGFDHVMVDWYQVQLERFCQSYNGKLPIRKDFWRLKLVATFVAGVVTILVTSIPDPEQNQSYVADVNNRLTKIEAKIPDQVIQFLNFTKDRKEMLMEDMALHQFIGVYFVYLALEPHLDMLELILDRLEQATDAVNDKQKMKIQIEPFVESLRRNITKYSVGSDTTSLLGLFSGYFAYCRDPDETKKHISPNVEKLIDVTDKILAHCDALLSSPSDGSDPCNLKRLTKKLEDDFDRHRRQGANEPTQLRAALEEAYKTAQARGDSSDKRNCKCIVARIQLMLAGLDLQDGKTEPAIQRASEAFNHQLYCQEVRINNISGTVGTLFDAFDMCDDSEARKSDLLRKLFNGHAAIYGPDHEITNDSHNKLIRLLCSTGSIMEAADFVEKLIDSSSYISSITNYSAMTVVLLLLMSGETERVVNITESMLRAVKATKEPYPERQFNEICQFVTLLREVGASGLASFRDFDNNEFRKRALILVGDISHSIDWPPIIYQDWMDNRLQFLRVNDNFTNDEYTSQDDVRRIDTTEQLYGDDLLVLWFDTIEQVLRRDQKDISTSLFAPLEHQLKLRNVDVKFKLKEDELEWSVKCFLGMFQRQELWFQKTCVRTDGDKAGELEMKK